MTHSNPVRARLQASLLFVVGVLVLYFAREVFVPLALALILTFLLSPVVNALRKLCVGQVPSALISLGLGSVVICCTVGLIGIELMDVAGSFPNYKNSIHQRVQQMRGIHAIDVMERAMQSVRQGFANGDGIGTAPSEKIGQKTGDHVVGRPMPVEVVSPEDSALATIRSFLTPLLRPIGVAGLVFVFTAFILIKKDDVRNRIVRLAGVSQISVTTLALEDAERRVGHYLGFALMINSCFGALITLGLFLIGLPNVALWGIIAGLMRFVPYAGILISVSFPLLLSLAVFPGWSKPGLIVLLFFGLEVIVANFLEPIIYGANTGTSPLGLLVAAVFWTVLWGPVGLVLSTPLTVCLVVLGRYVPQLSFLYILLAEEPPLTQEACLYQRLLAADREESQAMVDKMLEDGSLVEVYDQLVIPALRLAEQDRHKGALQSVQADSIFAALGQMIIDVETRTEKRDTVDGTSEHSHAAPLRFEPAESCRQRVACMAVLDQADEICATMLAQSLHWYGCPCIHFPSHWIHELDQDADDIIFLSALPPFAFVSARSYCARIRRRLPSSIIIVCMWGYSGDPEKIKERFGSAKPDYVITRLAEALELVLDSHLVERP